MISRVLTFLAWPLYAIIALLALALLWALDRITGSEPWWKGVVPPSGKWWD